MSAWMHGLAGRYLLSGVLTVLLLADLLAGLNWMLAADGALRSPAYSTAKLIAPMGQWGELLVLLTIFATVFLLAVRRGWLVGFLAGPVIACTWAFWTIMFAATAWHRPDTSYFGAIVCGALFLLHLLVGLALWHQPQATTSTARD